MVRPFVAKIYFVGHFVTTEQYAFNPFSLTFLLIVAKMGLPEL